MGGGSSTEKSSEDHPFESVDAAGKSLDNVDRDIRKNDVGIANSTEEVPSHLPTTTANDASATEEVDRSEIERNKNGCEEPSSADPELWNIDNCEVDILVKYKMGGQMWYVQSRMRENTAKNPPKPIPGFPMNKKAEDAKRFYSKDDEEFNVGSTNFTDAKGWKVIESNNPPVSAAV